MSMLRVNSGTAFKPQRKWDRRGIGGAAPAVPITLRGPSRHIGKTGPERPLSYYSAVTEARARPRLTSGYMPTRRGEAHQGASRAGLVLRAQRLCAPTR